MRACLLMFVAACGGGTVTSPPLVMPADRANPEGDDAFVVDPRTPYARLFDEGATWKLPPAQWVGQGLPPTVTCTVSAVKSFASAKVAYLACRPDRELGPAVSGLPAYGVVATAKGLWITSNLAHVAPPPETEEEVGTLIAAHPMRIAAAPQPTRQARTVEGAGDQKLTIASAIELAPHGDAWCATDENTAATETVTSILCVQQGRGVVGVQATYRSRGIVIEAIAAGTAPPPPASAPLHVDAPVPAEQVTLETPGKGKRAPLVLRATVGATQAVEYVIDGRFRQQVGTQPAIEQASPTITLRGTARVDAIEADGSVRYRYVVEKAAAGAAADPAFTQGLATLEGLIVEGTVGRDGRLAKLSLHVERPTAATADALSIIAQSLPPFTALPAEPVAPGARWTARHTRALFGAEVEIVQRSRLTERKGGRAVILSETSIAPIEREVGGDRARLVARGGITTQLVEGSLVPTRIVEQTLVTSFTPGTGSTNPAKQSELVTRTRVLPK